MMAITTNSSIKVNAMAPKVHRTFLARTVFTVFICINTPFQTDGPGELVPGRLEQAFHPLHNNTRLRNTQHEKATGLGWYDRDGVGEGATAIKHPGAIGRPFRQGRCQICGCQPGVAAVGRPTGARQD